MRKPFLVKTGGFDNLLGRNSIEKEVEKNISTVSKPYVKKSIQQLVREAIEKERDEEGTEGSEDGSDTIPTKLITIKKKRTHPIYSTPNVSPPQGPPLTLTLRSKTKKKQQSGKGVRMISRKKEYGGKRWIEFK